MPRLALPVVLALSVIVQAPIRQVSLIVTGGTVVTMDGDRRVLPDGAVAIDGDSIVAVDTSAAIQARFTASTTVEASTQVVLPGLVNTHGHAPMDFESLLSRVGVSLIRLIAWRPPPSPCPCGRPRPIRQPSDAPRGSQARFRGADRGLRASACGESC